MNLLMKKAIGSIWAQYGIYRFIRLYSLTFRFRVENEDEWMAYHKGGGHVLLCVWHQQFFSAIRYFKKYKRHAPALMISQSRDGDIIAGVAKLSGWYPVRGSSSRGGKSALKEMIQHVNQSGLAAHIMDGPRGPMGVAKAGAIRLALTTNAVIVPFYIHADRAWYFNSWDKFFIPKPFAKVTLTFDHMIHLPGPESELAFEALRQQVETVMKPALRFDPAKTTVTKN